MWLCSKGKSSESFRPILYKDKYFVFIKPKLTYTVCFISLTEIHLKNAMNCTKKREAMIIISFKYFFLFFLSTEITFSDYNCIIIHPKKKNRLLEFNQRKPLRRNFSPLPTCHFFPLIKTENIYHCSLLKQKRGIIDFWVEVQFWKIFGDV